MNESTPSSDEQAPERPSRNRSDMKSPGELLREGRIAQDYSVEDLCAETKLSEKAVEALESNRFDELSQPIFAGGYYRQCAKVLDIDVDTMVAAYEAWGGKKTSSQTATPEAVDVVPQDVTPTDWRVFGVIGVVVLLIIVGLVVLFMPSDDTAGDTAAADGGTAALSGQQSAAGGGSASIGSGNSSATSSGRPAASGSRDRGNSLRVSPGPSDSVDAASGVNAAQPAQNTGPRPGGRNVNDTLGIDREAQRRGQQQSDPEAAEPDVAPNHLVLNFTGRSWVDIRDASGTRLLTGIYESGETHEFDGETPYRITLGYAPGVEMTIGGESVDVAGQTTSNSTARLTVEARDSEG